MQSEASECGLACLAMVASYYGHRIDLSTLRRQHPIPLNGVTLRSIIEIARHLNLTTRAVRLEPRDLKLIKRPRDLSLGHESFRRAEIGEQARHRAARSGPRREARLVGRGLETFDRRC